MTKIIVDRALCQASFDWHFVREVKVLSKTESRIEVETQIERGSDPYMERLLGHYSSVRHIDMAFPAYTILDERCPLRVLAIVEAAIEGMFRDALLEGG
jgi:hypothetical protein